MIDGVKFNPFTGKVFTAEEIAKLDTDGDKSVSYAELQENMSWLSGEGDKDGSVEIGDKPSTTLSASGTKVYQAAQKNGVQDSASDAAQLKEFMSTIQDAYIEQYMQSNPDLSAADKSSMIAFIKSTGAEFLNEYTQKNTKVPYDTKAIAAELMAKLDAAAVERKEATTSVNKQIEDLKNGGDEKFDKLASYADKADNDFVTGAEFKEMKQQAIAYLMNQMLNGSEDTDFLSGINSNYKNDSNYKAAMTAIKSLETEKDPAKLKDLIKQAQDSLDKFLGVQNADGSSKLNNVINGKNDKNVKAQKDAVIDGYKDELSKLNDSMIDSYSKTRTRTRTGVIHRYKTPSSEDVASYTTKLGNVLDAFIAQYKGDGRNIENEYRDFVSKVMQESDAVTRAIDDGITDSADKYAELKDMVNGTGSYTSADEKSKILDKTAEFVMNELYQGKNDITLLKSIYPEYASDKNFAEALKLMDGIKTSATPKEDMAKALELIKTMLKTVGADKIIDGVKNQKTPAINFGAIDREALTSAISGYDNNESLSTGRYKNRNDSIDDIQNQAKQKLEELRSKLHAQLKEQMGADYDKAKVDEFIDDAIYQTITQFTDMRVDKNGKHYTTNDAGFVTSKSGSKSRGVVNIKQLVDAFLTNFQAISAKASQPVDPSKNPVDRLDVVADTSLANDYQDKKVRTYRSTAEAKLQLKTQISLLANQLKAKLKQQLGKDYNSTEINRLIEQATFNVVSDSSAISQSRKHTNRFLGMVWSKGWDEFSVNTATIANKFFDEFDKLYEESKTGVKKPEDKPKV